MSDEAEMVQRGIGVLTATLSWQPDDPASAQMFKESLRALVRLDDPVSISFSGGTPEQTEVLRELLPKVVESVIGALAPDYTRLVLGMATGFKAVADAYQRDVPDSDIEGILQAAALHLAEDE
ncbi:hypothetical protein [Sinomonas sp.]|jgi:hypothetical protein|uniref:hypothetical protein n=1 Tax=Sinomonas sp. TaxID=1914986 RepID=UPI003F808ECD